MRLIASLGQTSHRRCPTHCRSLCPHQATVTRIIKYRCYAQLRSQVDTAPATLEKLLENYWEARGVFNPEQRQQLVQIAKGLKAAQGDEGGSWQESSSGAADDDHYDGIGLASSRYQLQDGAPLPGIPTTWAINQSVPEIAAVSQRLLELHELLGAGNDVDVIWMVIREPLLLTASRNQLMSRLMAMRLASASVGVDVVKVVERQPSLLLDDSGALGDWAALDQDELVQALQAWECGVASDTDPEWRRRMTQLRTYRRQYGDTSVGFRDGDDLELARWAAKQRRDIAAGLLSPDKAELLQELGFEPDADDAEWLRWFLDLARFKEMHGHASPLSLSAGADFYLINWCSVQRVAYRCRVLNQRRLDLLNSIDFDWTGADPLS